MLRLCSLSFDYAAIIWCLLLFILHYNTPDLGITILLTVSCNATVQQVLPVHPEARNNSHLCHVATAWFRTFLLCSQMYQVALANIATGSTERAGGTMML
jgi:hypothetical protein